MEKLVSEAPSGLKYGTQIFNDPLPVAKEMHSLTAVKGEM
jgi:hypothetical protein